MAVTSSSDGEHDIATNWVSSLIQETLGLITPPGSPPPTTFRPPSLCEETTNTGPLLVDDEDSAASPSISKDSTKTETGGMPNRLPQALDSGESDASKKKPGSPQTMRLKRAKKATTSISQSEERGCQVTMRDASPSQQAKNPDRSPSHQHIKLITASSSSSLTGQHKEAQQDNNNKTKNSRKRFRDYQEDSWRDLFGQFLDFCKANGHSLVPHTCDENPRLAQWVKRQRRQYKLQQSGLHSTLTDERRKELETAGFIWDSHAALWEARFADMLEYKRLNGNCNVPGEYAPNRKLSIWTKRQRRQYKLFWNGDTATTMTIERIARLVAAGFWWEHNALYPILDDVNLLLVGLEEEQRCCSSNSTTTAVGDWLAAAKEESHAC